MAVINNYLAAFVMLKVAIFALADVIHATKALLQIILNVIQRDFAVIPTGPAGGPLVAEPVDRDTEERTVPDRTPRMSRTS